VKYRVTVDYQEFIDPAFIHISMQTSSLGTVIIPTSNWFKRESYAGGILLRVTSSCAVGYQYNHSTNPTA
jgi:hypothetical protein